MPPLWAQVLPMKHEMLFNQSINRIKKTRISQCFLRQGLTSIKLAFMYSKHPLSPCRITLE